MSDINDGFIHVEYNHVHNAAEDMIQQTRAIDGTLSNLDMELSELKEKWWGSDAEAYEKAQANWNAAVAEMQTLLSSHADLLSDVAGNYQITENHLSQLWSEVSIGK